MFMTMKKLAELAGVSVSTVSKAFSGSNELSEATREYIFEIARKNGCYDKYCKSVFEKTVVAVICPEFQSGYYSQQLTFLKKEIEKRGGVMLVGCYDFDEAYRNELMSYFTENAKVDGIILYNSVISKMKYNIPVVVIDDAEDFNSVSLSMQNAVKEAIEHFAENGHQDIAFIGEKLTKSKCELFAQAMKESGLDIKDDYIIESTYRFEEAGYNAMNRLLELENPPTAVLAAYDSIAVGIMKSIYEHGLSIPGDISLIGMDDIRENPYLNVALTSITSYNEELCEIIVDMLFDRIKNGNGKVKKIKVSTELVKRSSVGQVKNKKQKTKR